MTMRIYWVDVFTSTPLTGNQLAVILGGEHMSSAQMQALAAELHLAEICFVLPSRESQAAYRVRIFTTTQEIPLAGHPAVGTAWVMASEGLIPLPDPVTRIYQETAAGVLAVDIERDDVGNILRVTMTQPAPVFGDLVEPGDLEPLLGLPLGEIERTGLQPQIVSTALRQVMVPVTSERTIYKMRPDMRRLAVFEEHLGTLGFAVFHMNENGTVHQRVFCPTDKVPEDPATGSAAGAVGAYLARWGQLGSLPARLLITQGSEIGRPAQLEVTIQPDGDRLSVQVGGQVVPIMRGELLL